jgi:hypothetical protein
MSENSSKLIHDVSIRKLNVMTGSSSKLILDVSTRKLTLDIRKHKELSSADSKLKEIKH